VNTLLYNINTYTHTHTQTHALKKKKPAIIISASPRLIVLSASPVRGLVIRFSLGQRFSY
jgi:hypothetical protein